MQKNSDYLRKLVENHKITEDGRNWLTLALDPFHDYDHQAAGYPDSDGSQTTVSCYNYQTEVSTAGGGPYDVHIFNAPPMKPVNGSVYTLSGALTTIADTNPLQAGTPIGPLTIMSNVAGSELGLSDPVSATQVRATLPAVNNLDLASGISRIIGMGYEIVNTTPEMYKSGTLTAYRMPQAYGRCQTMKQNFAGTVVGPVGVDYCRLPPNTVAEANLLKGTRSWGAAEGAYVTCVQSTINNPLTMLGPSSFLMVDPPDSAGAATLSLGSTQITVGPATSPNTTTMYAAVNKLSPFDISGVFLTGLSAATTLTIRLKVYVERAPTFFESAIAVLASPSAGYDVHALELYAQAISCLPVAVKVGENAKGDWWRMVVNVVKSAAIPIGLALNPFIPGAAAVGAAVGSIAGQVDTRPGKSISKQVETKAKAMAKAAGRELVAPRSLAVRMKGDSRKRVK